MNKRYLIIYLMITVAVVILGVAGYLMPFAYLTYLSSFMNFLVYAVITIAILWVVVFDADKRYPKGSYGPIIWALVVFFMNLVGLVLYVLLRPKKESGG